MKKAIALILCLCLIFPFVIVSAEWDDVDLLCLTVRSDGTSDLSYTGQIDAIYHDILIQQYEPMGYRVEVVESNALKLSKSIYKDENGKVAPFNISMPGVDVEYYEALVIDNENSTEYIMNAYYDFREYPSDEELMRIEVELPVKPDFCNADEIVNGKYIWHMMGRNLNNVQFKLVIPHISVMLNGQKIVFDQQPFEENGRVLVPVRAIAEAMGADVSWDHQSSTAYIDYNDISISMPADSSEVEITSGKGTNKEKSFMYKLDVPLRIIGGRTYVPVRFISQTIGANVSWDEKSHTVNIIN